MSNNRRCSYQKDSYVGYLNVSKIVALQRTTTHETGLLNTSWCEKNATCIRYRKLLNNMTLFEDGFFHVMKEHDIQKRLLDLVESSLLKEFMWGVVKSHLQPKFYWQFPNYPVMLESDLETGMMYLPTKWGAPQNLQNQAKNPSESVEP